jgi:pimeloyl-ACP methyl ester carboxylesterase
VFDRLVDDGHTVLAPPNPLRGLPWDACYTASVIDQLDGPIVLVGHSHGGAVITVAGGSDKVAGLVYVADVAPDEGESVNDLQGRFPSLAIGPLVRPASLADGSVEVSIDPARFHDVFCANLSDGDTSWGVRGGGSLVPAGGRGRACRISARGRAGRPLRMFLNPR